MVQPVKGSKDIKFVRNETDCIVYELGSGNFSFTVKRKSDFYN
jgi:hypothetical protein